MNMENNTLLSHELEEMRSQISLLKEKLDRQTIVNEEHIRRSMKTKMSDINRIVSTTIVLGVFALFFSTCFFYTQGFSHVFVAVTAVMLAVCLAITIAHRVNLGKIDFSGYNIVETARLLGRVRTHYADWHKIAIPLLAIWFGWLMYEVFVVFESSAMMTGFVCGSCVGVLVGGFLGFRINRKVTRKANEILSQIEELQKAE